MPPPAPIQSPSPSTTLLGPRPVLHVHLCSTSNHFTPLYALIPHRSTRIAHRPPLGADSARCSPPEGPGWARLAPTWHSPPLGGRADTPSTRRCGDPRRGGQARCTSQGGPGGRADSRASGSSDPEAPAPAISNSSNPIAEVPSDSPRERRRSPSSESSSTRGPGSHRRYAQPWTRAPSRLLHCARPTTFRPRQETSPGPTPAKHTRSLPGAGTDGPVWTVIPVLVPKARAHHSPATTALARASSDQRGSPRGTQRSAQICAPGRRRTAPPPLRLRTTDTPWRWARPASTTELGWVLPRTTSGRSTSQDHAPTCGPGRLD